MESLEEDVEARESGHDYRDLAKVLIYFPGSGGKPETFAGCGGRVVSGGASDPECQRRGELCRSTEFFMGSSPDFQHFRICGVCNEIAHVKKNFCLKIQGFFKCLKGIKQENTINGAYLKTNHLEVINYIYFNANFSFISFFNYCFRNL